MQAYVARLDTGQAPDGSVIAACAGNPDIADHLIALHLAREKTADSGPVGDCTTSGDPLPHVGDHWIALRADGRPACVLSTASVESHPFNDIPEHMAIAEGEGARAHERGGFRSCRDGDGTDLAVRVQVELRTGAKALADAEARAGALILEEMITSHGLTATQVAEWCAGGLTVREVGRLRRLGPPQGGTGRTRATSLQGNDTLSAE